MFWACSAPPQKVSPPQKISGYATEWYNRSLDIKLQVLEPNDPSISSTYKNTAVVLKKKGDYEHALKSYNKALVIYKSALGENHSDAAACLSNMVLFMRDRINILKL